MDNCRRIFERYRFLDNSKMKLIINTTLMLLQMASAVVKGIQSTIQNICDIIETSATDTVSNSLVNDKDDQRNLQTVLRIPRLSDAKCSILISNLSQQKIIITDTDIFHTAPLSVEFETGKESVNNVFERCGDGEQSLEHIDSQGFETAQPKYSRIQTRIIFTTPDGKATTPEVHAETDTLNFKDPLNLEKKAIMQCATPVIGSNRESENDNIRIYLSAATDENSRENSDKFDWLGKFSVPNVQSPGKYIDELKERLYSKSVHEPLNRIAGVKRKNLVGYKYLGNPSASEAITSMNSYIPPNKRWAELEETIQESVECSSKSLGNFVSLEPNLWKFDNPVSNKKEADKGFDPNFSYARLENAVEKCSGAVCKDRVKVSLDTTSESENNSSSGTDRCDLEKNENITANEELDGIKTEEGLIQKWTLKLQHGKDSNLSNDCLSSQAKSMTSQERSDTARRIHEIVHDLIKIRNEQEPENVKVNTKERSVTKSERDGSVNQRKTSITPCKEQTDNEKVNVEEAKIHEVSIISNGREDIQTEVTSVKGPVSNGVENQFKSALTPCEEEMDDDNKVKANEEVKIPELESENYIRQEIQKLSKDVAENELILKSFENKMEDAKERERNEVTDMMRQIYMGTMEIEDTVETDMMEDSNIEA
ncbi:hypothetical protein NPIL_87391 [Nephila pilipes]|uniref:Uncharacterized protein n=1 Tax=Nephila pilipes TaxID=299642 RepID=A0A8X6I3T2_NEPPI|nr:hypothetical protein NPIL_87391 [Nephila pilipes]